MCVKTSWKQMTNRQLNRRVTFICFIASAFAITLATAHGGSPANELITNAERMDRMGAVGVLSAGFIMSLGALAYLIRLQYGKMLEIMDRNSTTMVEARGTLVEVKSAIVDVKGTMVDVKGAIEQCQHHYRRD